jgi:hypothetical protein
MDVNVYPESSHAFDGDPARTGAKRLGYVENYMDCRLFVEPDGSMSLGERQFAARDSDKVLAALKSTCMRKGASIWTHPVQKARATEDAIAFVRRVFATATR